MKKSNEEMQVRVGAFVAIGIFVLLLIVFLLGSEKNLFEHQYELTARFDDISGLRIGAPVHLAGINVGTVSDINFDRRIERKKVKLTLEITSKFQERIREDSVATIESQGLLGDKLVAISVGSADKKILADGDELVVISPITFSELMEKGKQLLDNANHSAATVASLLDEVKTGKGMIHGMIYDPRGGEIVSQIDQITRNMETVSGKVVRGEGTLGALVNDPTLFNDMKTLIGKANRNKLLKAVIRWTLHTKDKKLLEKD